MLVRRKVKEHLQPNAFSQSDSFLYCAIEQSRNLYLLSYIRREKATEQETNQKFNWEK